MACKSYFSVSVAFFGVPINDEDIFEMRISIYFNGTRRVLQFVILSSIVISLACVTLLVVYFVFARPATVQAPNLGSLEEVVELVPGTVVSLLNGAPKQDGGAFQETRRRDLYVNTSGFGAIPYVIESRTIRVQRLEETELYLSGNQKGDAPWRVDKFLLLESFIGEKLYTRAIIGGSDPVLDSQGQAISQLGPAQFEFPAKTIEISAFIPPGRAVVLRVSALGDGIEAEVSALFLLVE